MCPRHQHLDHEPRPSCKEFGQGDEVILVKYRESRKRRSLVAIKGGRYAPDTSSTHSKLLLLLRSVFQQPVRWIRHHGMYRVRWLACKPSEGVSQVQHCLTMPKDRAKTRFGDGCAGVSVCEAVGSACHALKNLRRVEPEIRSNRRGAVVPFKYLRHMELDFVYARRSSTHVQIANDCIADVPRSGARIGLKDHARQ